jgi:hypothetical protein
MNFAKKKLFGLGRLKSGEMNKTEKAYSLYLEGLMHIGEIIWWRFEGIKFKLADNCHYSPDFAIMKPDGEIQIIDVKGSLTFIQDDAKVKIKVAAEEYPFRFFLVAPRAKSRGGGWENKEVGNKKPGDSI